MRRRAGLRASRRHARPLPEGPAGPPLLSSRHAVVPGRQGPGCCTSLPPCTQTPPCCLWSANGCACDARLPRGLPRPHSRLQHRGAARGQLHAPEECGRPAVGPDEPQVRARRGMRHARWRMQLSSGMQPMPPAPRAGSWRSCARTRACSSCTGRRGPADPCSSRPRWTPQTSAPRQSRVRACTCVCAHGGRTAGWRTAGWRA